MELERLYGVRDGSSNDNVTQSDLAAKLGMSVDTLQNYKMLADMIPELEEHQKKARTIYSGGNYG